MRWDFEDDDRRRGRRGRTPAEAIGSRRAPSRNNPLDWLTRDTGDQVEVVVVVQHGDSMAFGHSSDEQVREFDAAQTTTLRQLLLDVQRAFPFAVVARKPLVRRRAS